MVELPTTLDTSELENEARRAARLIEQAVEVDIPVNADTAVAEARIAAVTRAREVPVNVSVNRAALRAVTSTLESAMSAIGPIAKFGGIGLLAGGGIAGLTSLTVGVAQAAGAVGALAAAMLSAGGAAGVLSVALIGQGVAMAEQQQDIKTATDALAKLQPGTEEYADKLKELNGLQRTFNQTFGPAAAALDNLKNSWSRFMKATETRTLALMADGMDTITGILPKLVPLTNAAAVEMRELVNQFARWTRSSGFTSMLDWVQTNGIPTLTRFARALGNVALAFGPIIQVFTPFANQMMRGLVALSEQFRTFIDAAMESGALQDFAAGSVEAFKTLGRLVADVAMSLVAIGRAASAAGGGVLGGLGRVFDRLREFLESATGQGALKGFFAGIADGFAALGRAMGPVGSALGSILPALGSILGSIGKAAGAALKAIAEPLALLAAPLADVAAVLATGIARALREMGPGLEMLAAGLGRALVGMVEALAPVLPRLARAFGRLAITLAQSLVPVLPGLVRAFAQLVPILPVLLRSLANMLPAITPLLVQISNLLPRLARSAVDAARTLVPVTTAIGGLAGPIRQVTSAITPWVAKFAEIEASIRGGFLRVVGTLLVGALKTSATWLRILGRIFSGDFSGALDVAKDAVKDLWGWLDNLNNKLHEYMVKLDAMPGIEIPGIGDEEHKKPLGPLDKSAPHGPSAPVFNYNIVAHDYEDFRRHAARRNRRANAGGVAFAP
jgi:phage-related protein